MDPALPPGGLYRIFEQYDAIKSHATRDDGPPPDDDDPPWEPPPAPAAPPAAKAPPTPPKTAPTSQPPAKEDQVKPVDVSNTPTQEAPKEGAANPQPSEAKFATPLKTKERAQGVGISQIPTLRTKERVELANRSTQQALTDVTQPRPLGKPWSEDRAQRATELMEQNLQKSRQKIDQQNEMVNERLHQAQDKKY